MRLPDALSARELSFCYGRQTALDTVDVSVPTGRFVTLLGSNGAGKTTLFSIVTGLYSSGEGSVHINGHDLRKNPLAALAGMGVVFQRTTLDLDLSVRQNLVYACALQGIERQAGRRRIAQSIEQHGLAGLEERKAAGLSGGQRRRVELARALLHEPSLLLLDEPTVGLDMHSRLAFVAHVRSLCRDYGTGILWATHLLDEIEPDDAAVVLERGQVMAQGRVDQLCERHEVDGVGALFAAVTAASAA